MQARRQLRSGQAIKLADLSKPALVQKDQSVITMAPPRLDMSDAGPSALPPPVAVAAAAPVSSKSE